MFDLPKIFGLSAATWTCTLLWAGFLSLPVFSYFQSTDQGITSLMTLGAVLMTCILGPITVAFWIADVKDLRHS